MVKHISRDCKCKFNIVTCTSNKKWNNETCHCGCKNYRTCNKDCSWNPNACICEKGKCLQTIANDSKFVWDQSIFAMHIVATYVTNTVPTNVSSTVSTNFHKKARYKMNCYILHTVLLVTKLLLMIAIICYHYANHGSKVKNILSC